MYTHRGAYLNALGEIIEVGYTSDTVFLWTLPMFHCNGWCNTWAVTAVGGTHLCLRNVDSEEIWRLFDQEGVTHYCGAPVVHIGLGQSPLGASAGIAGDRRGCRGAALPHAAGRDAAAEPVAAPPVRADRDLRAAQRSANGRSSGTSCPMRHGPSGWPGRASSFLDIEPVRVVDEDMRDVPADGATVGEVVMRGNDVMKGYSAGSRAPRQKRFAVGGSTPAIWRVMHPDGYRRAARPRQGHHHLRRREHLHHRGGAGRLDRPSRGAGVVRWSGDARRAAGASDRDGVRHHSAPGEPGRPRTSSSGTCAASGWPTSNAPRRSSSASSPRRPPARPRSSFCENGSGAGGRSASAEADAGRQPFEFPQNAEKGVDCGAGRRGVHPPRFAWSLQTVAMAGAVFRPATAASHREWRRRAPDRPREHGAPRARGPYRSQERPRTRAAGSTARSRPPRET